LVWVRSVLVDSSRYEWGGQLAKFGLGEADGVVEGEVVERRSIARQRTAPSPPLIRRCCF
jgi:hypothetical protein